MQWSLERPLFESQPPLGGAVYQGKVAVMGLTQSFSRVGN